jgi:addiction module RelE/StbE family toxin
MGKQVALSPSAKRDRRDIVRYISSDSPERAVILGQFLVSSIKRLADFPELGKVVPEFDDPSLREIVVRSYRVIYRVDHGDCRVDVARFWHGACGTLEVRDA